MTARPRLLVAAGHDPSGAGLDADRSSCTDLPLQFVGVVTARTDQDDRGVRSIGAVDPDLWFEEARAQVERGVGALKFGLLPGVRHVERAAELVRVARTRTGVGVPVVLDPVIAASSGGRFLDERAVGALREALAGVVLTPNLAELAELARRPLEPLRSSLAARTDAARTLLARGARAVVVKGGHGLEDPAVDLLVTAGDPPVEFPHARIAGGKIRGSGCRFASHLAGRLALGETLETAIRAAAEHVGAALRGAAAAGDRKPLQSPPGTVSFPTPTTRL